MSIHIHTHVVTHVSIAAVLFVGLIAISTHRGNITETRALLNRSTEMTLIPIQVHSQTTNSESDHPVRK